MKNLEVVFKSVGGQFITPIEIIKSKLTDIQAFIFDWDGVFNDGAKYNAESSTFAESDSMGTNMLRFSYWLENQEHPVTAILTGANNHLATYLAKRENFNYLFLKCNTKRTAIDIICKEFDLKYHEIAFVFDDILDLDVAEICGLRLMVKRQASPLFEEYVLNNSICDYISGSSGKDGAVREICELLMGLNGNYDTVIDKRKDFNGDYETYLNERYVIETKVREHDGI